MKLFIESNHTESGHSTAHIFDSRTSCATRNPENIKGVVHKDGTIKFADEAFRKKIAALAAVGKVGFSPLKAGGKVYPGYLYLDIDSPEYIIAPDSINESSEPEARVLKEFELFEAETIVPNDVDLRPGDEVYVTEEIKPEDMRVDVQKIYRDSDAIRRQDEKKVIGEFNSVRGTVILRDKELIEVIKECALNGVKTPAGFSRMYQREGLYYDFIAPKYTITQILPTEKDEEEEEEIISAHFLNDLYEEPAVDNRTPEEVNESINESIQASYADFRDLLKSLSSKDLVALSKGIKKAAGVIGNSSLGNSGGVEKNTPEQLGEQSHNLNMNQYIRWAQRY